MMKPKQSHENEDSHYNNSPKLVDSDKETMSDSHLERRLLMTVHGKM